MKIGITLLWVLIMAAVGPASELTQKKLIKLPEDNPMARLKPGREVDKVQIYCSICHSTDYIVRQPRQDEQHWQAEVKKMIVTYGAPVAAADAEAITRYLSTAYGLETPHRASGGNVR